VAAAACDAGSRREQAYVGPSITVTAVNVGPDRPLPANGAIQIAFDRYLLPVTDVRQSFPIVDGQNRPLPPELLPNVSYDPVARTVTIIGPRGSGEPWLTEGQLYKLLLLVPEDDSDASGARAIDRATLDPAQRRVYEFFVGPPTVREPLEPKVHFCTDVLPIFVAKCAGGTCHGPDPSTAASGLVLTSSAGVAHTAIDRIAQGANTGGRTARGGEAPGRIFGVDLPLIAPGNPGRSWLLYKIELARLPRLDVGPNPGYVCTGEAGGEPLPPPALPYRPLVPLSLEADEIERDILNDHVLGREMPFPASQVEIYEQQSLTFDERERVRLWIAQGAQTPECGGCGLQSE
jgi:hypothetical protein